MSIDEFLTILKQGGGTVAILALLIWTLTKLFGKAIKDAIVAFFTSLIAEMKLNRETLAEHMRRDNDDHAETQQQLARVEGKIDAIFDLTPVEHKRTETPSRGVPAGRYQYSRPGTKDR